MAKMKRILCSDWLPERARKAYLSSSGFPALVSQEKSSLFGHIVYYLLTKLVWQDSWILAGFFFFVFINLDFVSLHKSAEVNLANIQSSWPQLGQ